LAKPVELTIRGRKALQRIFKRGSTSFLKDIHRAWTLDSNTLLGDIIKTQLSGRRGNVFLNRRTGNAARALLNRTQIVGGDVISKFFLDANNPAKRYLPIHDSSWPKSRTIVPKAKKYLKFQTRDKKWHTVKSVTIPERTNIVETIKKKRKVLHRASLQAVLNKILEK